jgi:hypothetical protein
MKSAPRFNCNLFLLSGSFEEQWFLHCLSALQPRIFHACRDPWEKMSEFEEKNSLDIYYTNPTNIDGREALAAVRSIRKPELGHGLLIGGDENFITSPRLYYGARFVIRTYLAAFYRHPRIFTLPEGPLYRTAPDSRNKLDLGSPISVFFSGQIKYSRVRMAKIFRDQPGSFIIEPVNERLSPDVYLKKLLASRFSLCPNGNTTPDTLRLYEALEAGVVPIAEKSFFYDYLGALFKGCPIPRFSRWSKAMEFVNDQSDEDYLRLRKDISRWWKNTKIELPYDLFRFVETTVNSNLDNFCFPGRYGELSYRLKALIYLALITSPSALAIRFRKLLCRAAGLLRQA